MSSHREKLIEERIKFWDEFYDKEETYWFLIRFPKPSAVAYRRWRKQNAHLFRPYRGETMGDVTRPQQDPQPGDESVTELVIRDLENRRLQGIKKYGTELKTFNGRDALVDAYQEALDLVMYLRQKLQEVTHTGVSRQTAREFLETQAVRNRMFRDQLDQAAVRPPDVDPITLMPVPPPVYTARAAGQETILQEAQRIVHGDRGESYGHPIFDLTRTADIATALLRTKLRPGQRLEAEDIAKLQVGTKLSRETFKPKRDNRVDMSGYSEVLDMIVEWRAAHPGQDPRDHYASE